MTTIAELETRVKALEDAAMSGDPSQYYRNHQTKLAEVNDPKKLTDAKIQEISGDDGSDDPENSANKDVAEQLRQERADAKKPAKK